MSIVGTESLEGWLMKKKKQSALSFLGNENKRWFKVKEVQGAGTKEWALCYFSTQHDKEAKGWIYLNDISEISDDGKSFTVVSPQRTMQLEAQTVTQQRLWIRGLVGLCPNAKTSGVQSIVLSSPDDTSEAKYDHSEAKTTDAKSSTNATFTPRRGSNDSQSRSKNKQKRDDEDRDRHRDAKEEAAESKSDGIAAATTVVGDNDEKHVAPRSASRMAVAGEDHRSSGFRSGTSDSGATSRLHSHIRKDNEGSVSPRSRDPGSSSRRVVGDDAALANNNSKTKSKDPGIFPPIDDNAGGRGDRSKDKERRGSQSSRGGGRSRSGGGDNRGGGRSESRERDHMAAESDRNNDNSNDITENKKLTEKEKNSSIGDLETLDIEQQHRTSNNKHHQHHTRRRANSGSRVGDSDEDNDHEDHHDDNDPPLDVGDPQHAGVVRQEGRPPRKEKGREDKQERKTADDDDEEAGITIDNDYSVSRRNSSGIGDVDHPKAAPPKKAVGGPPPPTAPPPPSSAPPRRAKDILDAIGGGGGGGNGVRKKSMDQIIAESGLLRKSFEAKYVASGGGGGGGGNHDDDPLEGNVEDTVDFKAEKQKRLGADQAANMWPSSELDVADEKVDRSSPNGGRTGSGSGGGPSKRPPLPPQGTRAPYTMPPTSSSSSSGSNNAAVNSSGGNNGGGSSSSSSAAAAGKSNTPPRRPVHPGTAVDPNFVDEDWDAADVRVGGEQQQQQRNNSGSRRKGSSGSVIPGQAGIDSGVKADENWLDDDFDT